MINKFIRYEKGILKKYNLEFIYLLCISIFALIFVYSFGFFLHNSIKENDKSETNQIYNISSKEGMKNTDKTVKVGLVNDNFTSSVRSRNDKVNNKKSNLEETKNTLAKDAASKTNNLRTIYMGAKDKPNIAITFDDGYNKKMIEKVLSTLKNNNARSTFFIIGKVLYDYPEVWKKAIAEGNQICNHTNSHQILTGLSEETIKKEILDWEVSAREVLGAEYVEKMKREFPYLRLPGGGGAKNNRILSIANENGYKVIGWNLETFNSVINPSKGKYSLQEVSNKIEKHILDRCSNGAIILLHFNKYDTQNIDKIVSGISKKGYDIQLLENMIK